MSFLRIESYRRGIIVSTVYNLLAKGLLFAVSLLVAYYFGSGEQTDVYFYVYNVAVLISGFFNMLNSTVLIPEAMRIRAADSELKSMSFFNFFIGLYLLATVLIVGVLLVWPIGAFATMSNFDVSVLTANKEILLYALPLIMLMTLAGLFTDILISYKFFTTTMIVSIINSLVSITFLLSLHNRLNILSLLIGLLIGFSLNVFILLYMMRLFLKWKFHFRIFPLKKRVWRNIGFAQAGNITSVLNNYVPFFLFSGFSPGVITALTFAQQLSALPNSLVTNHFTSVAAIKFNELYSKKEFQNLDDIFVSTTNFLVFVLMPISGLIFLFAEEIITIIFEHGQFNQVGVTYATIFLKYLGFQLPLLAVNVLVSRLFMSGQKIMQSFWYQIAFNVVLISILYLSVSKFGIIGYPITLVGMYFSNVIVCYYLEKLFISKIHYGKILLRFFMYLFLNVLCIISLQFLLPSMAIQHDILRILIGATIYLAIVIACSLSLNLNTEVNFYLKYFLNILTKKLGN